MKIVEAKKANGQADAAKLLARYIGTALSKGRNVVWFISGGSSIPVARATKALLGTTEQLRALVVDDKFAVASQEGVNAMSLIEGALFQWHDVRRPLYTGDLVRDAEDYASTVAECLGWADVCIGQFGIGEGYHTGGILPNMTGVAESPALVKGYEQGNIKSITITPECIRRLNVAFVNSFGEEKRELVKHFLISDALVTQEPTQVLKEAILTILITDVL